MKKNLRITPIQTDIVWEDIQSNLNNYDIILSSIEDTDLVILPEMFTTGFTMNTSLSETMDGETIKWMKKWSRIRSIYLCGSLIIEESSKFFNRFILISPEGTIEYYDKRHLFGFAGEDRKFTKGGRKVIWNIHGWKVCPMVCYDLRFPVWSRNVEGYDLLLYVASWPDTRIEIWRTLLRARAIENLSYVIGVNRIGLDGANLNYNGYTSIISPIGETLLEISQNPNINNFELSFDNLQLIRSRYNFLKDADLFSIK